MVRPRTAAPSLRVRRDAALRSRFSTTAHRHKSVRQAGVYKNVAEQASIPKFILEVFNATESLSDLHPAAQDGQANDLMDMFDWDQAPLDPLSLPQRTCPLLP